MRTYSKLVSFILSTAIAIILAAQSFILVQASGPTSVSHNSTVTWYVSTTGNDANGCAAAETPCLTINTAIGKSQDGDIIKVTEGNFSDNIFINKSVSLLGGWDASFSSNSGATIIEGKTITVDDYNDTLDKTVVIDRIIIRNIVNFYELYALTNKENLTISKCEIYNNSKGGGLASFHTLTVNNCNIHDNSGVGVQSFGNTSINASQISNNINESTNGGGGVLIYSGAFTVTNSLIHDNQSRYGGGGFNIYSDITLTISNSAIYQNSTSEGIGGGIRMGGYGSTVNINNTTVSRNQALTGGGLAGGNLYNNPLTLRNVTLTENSAGSGGGIYGEVILYNSIIGYNTAQSGANCAPLSVVRAVENNIIYKVDCAESIPVGTQSDYVDVDPLLLPFISEVGYAPLSSGSPAINTGDPSTCFGATDQRGAPRDGICDIGAYEYTLPGTPSAIYSVGGSKQRVPTLETFNNPFVALLLDANGTPVDAGYEVTFSAPANGPSGIFTSNSTKSEMVLTSSDGLATSSLLNANEVPGDYVISANAAGVSNTSNFLIGNGFWMVSPIGDDASDCLTALTPCQSLSGVIAKPNLFNGDVIRLAAGTYLPVPPYQTTVTVRKKAYISGGWDATFTLQNGLSNIPQTLVVSESGNAHVDHLVVEAIPYSAYKGGIVNSGTLYIENSIVKNGEQGFSNSGVLTISKTTITGNASRTYGGGLQNSGNGKVLILNSTISGNSADQAGAIFSDSNASPAIEIYNSTISNNTAITWGSGGIEGWNEIIIANSIIAGNHSPETGPYSPAYSPDCRGNFTSLGHNIVGNIGVDGSGKWPGCTTAFNESDQWGTKANPLSINNILLPLKDVGGDILMHPLTDSSLALNAGSTLPTGNSDPTACLTTDQRGIPRPQGTRCDIGAYEAESGTFSDVLVSNWAWKYIEAIYSAGITGGCSTNPLNYCPNTQVTRAQMAIFLETGMNGPTFTPPDATGTVFHDIPADHWAARWIEQLAADGITGGCGNGNYCPNMPINREQMAVFLLLAKHGPDYVPPAVGDGTGFNDVPVNHWAAVWIRQLAAEGITGGCGGGNYCPAAPVTRAQMAVFLQVTFGLPLP